MASFDRTEYDRYLQPDKGNAMDLVTAGVMATMFFTPMGGKIFSSAMRTAYKGLKFAGTAAREVGYRAVRYGTKPVLRAAWRGAKGTVNIARQTARFAGRAADIATRGGRNVSWPVLGAVAAASIAIPSGLEHDNLGATGDLTLSLHHGR